MTTDKQTIDHLFSQRGMFEKAIEDHKKKIRKLEDRKTAHDNELYSAASEYILEVLADPSIPEKEKYGRQDLTFSEIEKNVMEREPRFTEQDISYGLSILVLGTDPKVEEIVLKTPVCHYALKDNAQRE